MTEERRVGRIAHTMSLTAAITQVLAAEGAGFFEQDLDPIERLLHTDYYGGEPRHYAHVRSRRGDLLELYGPAPTLLPRRYGPEDPAPAAGPPKRSKAKAARRARRVARLKSQREGRR